MDLRGHPAARTTVAQDMLQRIQDDVAGFAATQAGRRVPYMHGLSPSQVADILDIGANGAGTAACIEAVDSALAGLTALEKDLSSMQQ